ncbi:ABC transporter permease [filamentous cyanobacterium CCP2]|nr:ABC transporter permease [filamentous cyanobacterium CCP2]
MLSTFFDRLFDSRFWALTLKEINQILRNKQLIFLLIFPPTIQLLIYGAALNPEVQFLKLGIVDYANSQTSRELVAAMTENRIFVPEAYLFSEQELGEEVRQGNITTGLVIPPEFDRRLANGQTAEIQVLVDGVDANTAGIASGYINQIVAQFSQRLDPSPSASMIEPEVVFLYNPGLRSSWFFVPGVLGVVLTLTSSLVSSSTVVREKDTGTLEQLLMTPAAAWEILLAKIVPLFVLLMGDVVLALGVGRLIFNLPFRGNFPIFMLLSALYVSVGIGIGIFLATISKNQRQVVLTSFFINLPLIQTSGAIAPIESMPAFFRYVSLINPLRHYVAISRGFLLKGIGVVELWQNILALGLFAALLLFLSTQQFKRQLG